MSPRLRTFFYGGTAAPSGPLVWYGCKHGVAIVIVCAVIVWLCGLVLYVADDEAPTFWRALRGDD